MVGKVHITGIILAGGNSSRMGRDKGLMLLNGKPFIGYIIDALRPLVSEIIIVSNHKAYDVFKKRRVTDEIENAGPVAGIYSGLKTSTTNLNFIISCDVPLLTTAVLRELLKANQEDIDIIQVASNKQSMPLIGLYHKRCAPIFYRWLQQGERRLRFTVKQCITKTVILPKELEIYTTNVNTPAQKNDLDACIRGSKFKKESAQAV